MKPSTRSKVNRKVEYLRRFVMGGQKKPNSATNRNNKTSISSNTQTTEVANRTNRNSRRVSMGLKIVKNQDSKYKNVKKTSFASVTSTSDFVSTSPASPPACTSNETSNGSVSVNPTNNRG